MTHIWKGWWILANYVSVGYEWKEEQNRWWDNPKVVCIYAYTLAYNIYGNNMHSQLKIIFRLIILN